MSLRSKIAKTLAIPVIVAAMVGIAAAPAHAQDSPAYYGSAVCSSTMNPGTEALGWGINRHQIGVNGYTYQWDANLGANPGYSRHKIPQNSAQWATISSPGGQRLISTSWACRKSIWG